MYDSFSKDYDRFVNWTNRLSFELPFIEREISALDRPLTRVLDAACGTGMHVIALAKRGFRAAGADISNGMVARARNNAVTEGVDVPFIPAGFGRLTQAFQAEPGGLYPFDALLCLGNSLPHLLTQTELADALGDFAGCLEPGGLLMIQNRNFDAVLRLRERWMEPQTYSEGAEEWLFLRFYDFEPGGLINFNIVSLHRVNQGAWQQQVSSTWLYPLKMSELTGMLEKAGFGQITLYGSMNGAPYDADTSGNLVITARLEHNYLI